MKRNPLALMGSFATLAALLSLAACKSKPAADEPSPQTHATEHATQPATADPAPSQPAQAQAQAPAQTAPTPAAPPATPPAMSEVKPAPTVAQESKKEEVKDASKTDPSKEEVKPAAPKPVVTFLNSDAAEPLSTKKLDSGVVIDELKLGEGSECKPGATVTINYHGTLKDGGTMFDSTRGKQPATFPLNRLIRGWQQGVPGMKPGGIRRLTIPYALAYGDPGRPPVIPPKADLVFIIELIGVVEPAK